MYMEMPLVKLQMWTFKARGPIFSSPCIHPPSDRHPSGTITHSAILRRQIVFGCHGKSVHCVTMEGEPVWRFDADSEVFATVCVLSSHTLPRAGKITVSPATPSDYSPLGTRLFEEPSSQCSATGRHDVVPAICDVSVPSDNVTGTDGKNYDVVVVCTTRGRVCLLDVADGMLLGECVLEGEVFSSPVVCMDKVYVGCRDDNLYCIQINKT